VQLQKSTRSACECDGVATVNEVAALPEFSRQQNPLKIELRDMSVTSNERLNGADRPRTLSVVFQTKRELTAGDIKDLRELLQLYSSALEQGRDDEVANITDAISELLGERDDSFEVLTMAASDEPIQKWLGFVSKRIHSLRKKAGLTQMQLAERCGLPQSHISRLERGEHSPSNKSIRAIATALGVHPKELDPSVSEFEPSDCGESELSRPDGSD
jgi:DNA-binding transcriptional regulator YiaG